MFYLHQSNQMEQLAITLCALLKNPLDDNPFVAEQILVQSPGMSQWLKLFIAEHLEVMANVEFPLPSSFIWALYKQLIVDLPDDSAFSKSDMCWKLLSILPQHLDDDEFVSLKHYLADDEDGLKAFQLCEKVADVFDQYLMYRPDWITSWEEGIDEVKDTDVSLQPWQPMLWRTLVTYTASLGQPHYHRANLHDILLEKMPSLLTNIEQLDLPPRLFIFGISALPQQQLHIFQLLSEFVDIHLMLFNPCQLYWGDIVDEKLVARAKLKFKAAPGSPATVKSGDEFLTVGNPLLASWGKLGRDYLEQLLLIDATPIDSFVEPQGHKNNGNLLCYIQTDIFNLTYRESMQPLTPAQVLSDVGKRMIAADDRSLRFHACHSPLREVEVLHDQLLAIFAQDSSIAPKDVIVMMPDVSLYSPYIAAVFNGDASNSNTRIPYAISDKGFSLENPIVISFLQLMDLPQSRFSASELLDLLAVPAIIHGMGLVPEDIALLRHWVQQVGIRWGVDSNHKQQLQLPDDELNTWRFGLQRLLLGYAMNDDQLVDGVLPFTDVEGQNADILGKLVYFVDVLIEAKTRLAEEATIADKCDYVAMLLDKLYLPDDKENQALTTIREVLNKLVEQQQRHNCVAKISQRVFAYQMAQQLNEKTASQRFLAGQVNFCTLLPMRSIPFKVICLLGLNDGDYPRFTAPIGFDLMAAGQTRKGDRSRRLDDRYLLLEALLSAREYLHISYVGRSMQDNSVKVPSILVSELLEYCQQGFSFAAQENLVCFHPLQPFNRDYFSQDSALCSFNRHWFRYVNQVQSPQVAEKNSSQPLGVDAELLAGGEIELNELLKFMLHPVKYFFNRTLQLYFEQFEQLEQDDEAFVLDGLSRYQILDRLSYSKLIVGQDLAYQEIDGYGVLPHREVGENAFAELDKLASGFVERLQQTSLTFVEPVEINLSVEVNDSEFRLLGWIKQLTTDGLLSYRPASIKSKDKLKAWFYHVVLAASGNPVKTKHIALAESLIFAPITTAQGQEILSQWLEWYQLGLQQPLPFFINSSDKWALTGKATEVNKAFLGSSFTGIAGEGDDPYISRVYPDVNQLPETFYTMAEQCFAPLIAATVGAEQEA